MFSTNVFIYRSFSKIKINLLKSVILYHRSYCINKATRSKLLFGKFNEWSIGSESVLSSIQYLTTLAVWVEMGQQWHHRKGQRLVCI